jgi:hypothetical protein
MDSSREEEKNDESLLEPYPMHRGVFPKGYSPDDHNLAMASSFTYVKAEQHEFPCTRSFIKSPGIPPGT